MPCCATHRPQQNRLHRSARSARPPPSSLEPSASHDRPAASGNARRSSRAARARAISRTTRSRRSGHPRGDRMLGRRRVRACHRDARSLSCTGTLNCRGLFIHCRSEAIARSNPTRHRQPSLREAASVYSTLRRDMRRLEVTSKDASSRRGSVGGSQPTRSGDSDAARGARDSWNRRALPRHRAPGS